MDLPGSHVGVKRSGDWLSVWQKVSGPYVHIQPEPVEKKSVFDLLAHMSGYRRGTTILLCIRMWISSPVFHSHRKITWKYEWSLVDDVFSAPVGPTVLSRSSTVDRKQEPVGHRETPGYLPIGTTVSISNRNTTQEKVVPTRSLTVTTDKLDNRRLQLRLGSHTICVTPLVHLNQYSTDTV